MNSISFQPNVESRARQPEPNLTRLGDSPAKAGRNLSIRYITPTGFLLFVALVLAGAPNGRAAGSAANDQIAKLTAVMQSAAPQKEKADACRELARIGDRDAVAALAALLPDENLSHMARYGLETIPDASVDKVLREALTQLKGRPLVGVIGSIGVRRDAKATKPLAKLLADSDADVAQAAARALGKIATPEAGKQLLKALPEVSTGNQVAFCEGLFRCAEVLASGRNTKQAIAIYDQVRKLQAPHQVRTAALRGAILARGKNGLPVLIEALHHNDYAVFASANRISREIPGEEVTRALADALSINSVDQQILLTQTLGKRGDPAALPSLFAVAKTADKTVRVAAIRAVSELCDPSAVRLFRDLLTDSDAQVAAAAKEGLGALPGVDADSAALFFLRSSDPNRRDLGLELVARRRMTSAIPDLFKLAKDGEPGVRLAAVKKIGELGSARDLSGVLDLLDSATTTQDIDATEEALNVIVAKSPDNQASAQKLAQSFSKGAPKQKTALLRVLAASGGPTALSSVRSAIKDPSPEVRTAAIRALGTWNNSDAAPALLELARNASDPGEKVLCLRGYLGLAGQSEVPADKALSMCRDALPLVQQTEEKKLLLGTLGNVQTPDSLALIVPYLGDDAVKDEAGTACVTLSERLLQGKEGGKNAAQTIEPLSKVAEGMTNPNLAKKAQSLLERARQQNTQK
ncbi:MAG TPA: HEAT repeat domain-containing protein [Verrucomicrobiae bacterium]